MQDRGQSEELLRRGAELRARSVRICAAAAEKMDTSRRLIDAAAEAKVALRARRREPAGARDGSSAGRGWLLAS